MSVPSLLSAIRKSAPGSFPLAVVTESAKLVAMEEDWDLHAVVRSFTASSSSSSSSASAAAAAAAPTDPAPHVPVYCSSFGVVEKDEAFVSPPDPYDARRTSLAELHELYKPFFPKPEPLVFRNAAVSALPSFGGADGQPALRQHPNPANNNGSAAAYSSGSCMTGSQSQASRSKRRKSQLKKVCHVPAESLSSDIWAWRKYGQKPIKGSPYPRGYYRCSSSKGCLARKQVERNRSDPGMFIVTYTAEHNHPAPTHRNSLAGSTRPKPAQTDTVVDPVAAAAATSTKAPCSSPTTSMEDDMAKAQSTNTEGREEKEGSMADDEEDGEVGLSDMALSDDFLEGLEGLTGGGDDEDCFLDRFPANFGHSWTTNNAAAATGGS